jgi:antirestriction protein ArdC
MAGFEVITEAQAPFNPTTQQRYHGINVLILGMHPAAFMEELRAELSSAFVATELGIPADIPRYASYLADWLKPLKDDKREIFRAAADAQRIVDMVLGFHSDFAARHKAQHEPDRPCGMPSSQPEVPRTAA